MTSMRTGTHECTNKITKTESSVIMVDAKKSAMDVTALNDVAESLVLQIVTNIGEFNVKPLKCTKTRNVHFEDDNFPTL